MGACPAPRAPPPGRCGTHGPRRPRRALHVRRLRPRPPPPPPRTSRSTAASSASASARRSSLACRRYWERFISGNCKYEEAARDLLTPKTGYGLASEFRPAGVFVRTVEDKPQAADAALHAAGIDWLLLVSDDFDFLEMVRRARESDLRTLVVGDGRTALGRHADLWVPWSRVENGQIGEEVLWRWQSKAGSGFPAIDDYDDDDDRDNYNYKEGVLLFSSVSFYEDDGASGDLDDVVDKIMVNSSGFGGVRISAFSEEEVLGDFGDDSFRNFEPLLPGTDVVCAKEEDGSI